MTSVGPGHEGIHPMKYAYKRWLRMAIDRMDIPHKAIYMELGVDQSTFSRWLDGSKEQELPAHLLPRVMALLDQEARDAFDDFLNKKAPERPGAS